MNSIIKIIPISLRYKKIVYKPIKYGMNKIKLNKLVTTSKKLNRFNHRYNPYYKMTKGIYLRYPLIFSKRYYSIPIKY
jgi:hypothetical protein